MAVKKRNFKKSIVSKKRMRPRSRPVPATAEAAEPIAAAESESRMSLAPFVIFALLVLALYFIFKKPELPQAHKASADIQVAPSAPAAAPAVAPANAAGAAPLPSTATLPAAPAAQAPQKRATSPAGAYVWNRKTTKKAPAFGILREAGSFVEVRVFKAGNVVVKDIRSDKGPQKTLYLSWDGTDETGKPVAPGTYYVRLSGAHGDMVEEILVK